MTDKNNDYALEIQRTLHATPEQVFDAWMTREAWQVWIGPKGLHCEVPLLEPAVGGRFQIRMSIAKGITIPVAGIYREVERPHRIVFNWGRADEPARSTLIAITLVAHDGGTALTLRHEGLESAASRDSHTQGWNDALDKLTAYLALRE